MEIRKTQIDDLDIVMGIYESARSFMSQNGNPDQWGNNYPPTDLIKNDISDGNSYVCLDNGRIVCVFAYIEGIDPTYVEIYEGTWLNDEPYGVVHRIASSGAVKGTASYCLNWSLEKCRNLKIDTHEDNKVMQNLLSKNGFTRCGIIYLENGSKRIAFQKKLQ